MKKIYSMPKLTDCSKGVLGEKFLSISTYIIKEEISQINNLMLHLKESEKQQTKHETERKKIIKIRVEINEIKK